MNAIELPHVNKAFGDFAIRDLCLAVPQGAICGLVGENGAGKSTAIRLLMGALHPDSGRITVLGADAVSPAFRDTKEDIGVVLEDAWFPASLTPAQLGRVMADTYRRWDAAAYRSWLNRFGLAEDKVFKDFSRGMRMKLAIAVALSHRAKLLVLDEATAGLDPIVRDEILDIFREFTREEDYSILMSSHILSDLEKLCDYIAFLHQGELVLFEEKDRLLEQYALVTCTGEQADSLLPEAVLSRQDSGYGGARCLVRRDLIPAGFQPERPSVEDVILALVKKEVRK